MEKFGVPADAPAAAVSDAEAERIKRRGTLRALAPVVLHSTDVVFHYLPFA
jgi:hypothetical protein